MSQIVKLRRSSVSGQKPTNTNLQLGELALNTTDGKVYMAKSGSLGPSVEELITTNTVNTGSITLVGDISAIHISGSLTGSFSGSIDGRGQVDYLTFNTSSAPLTAPSYSMWANTQDRTVNLQMGNNATLQIGQELYFPPVVNKTGVELGDGTLVMVNPTGVTFGGRLNIIPAIGNGTYPADLLVGVLTEAIPNNESGFATWFGYVRDILKTDIQPVGETWVEGDILYPHPTVAGKMTHTLPIAPALKSTIAAVTKTNGDMITLMVRPNLRGAISGQHDVNILSGVTTGDLFVRSGSVWTNGKSLNGNYTINGSLNATSLTGSINYNNLTNVPTLISGSLQIDITGTTGYSTFSSSIATTDLNQENRLDAIEGVTGSYATTGSNQFNGDQSISGSVIIGSGSFDNVSPEALHVGNSGSYNIAHFDGYDNNYAQINVQNHHSGSGASTDIVITADNGTENIHYVDLGINSSNYNAGYVGNENDAYLLNAGKDLYVGTIGGAGHPSNLNLFAQNKWETPQIRVSGSGQVLFNTLTIQPGYEYEFSGSINARHNLNVSGSISGSLFTGSFIGDGSGLYNIPASGVTGIEVDKIINGNASASIDNNGFYVNRDVFVDGILTAKELHIDYVTSSVLYQSGSTKFGDTLDDTHTFSGSVKIEGGLSGLSLTGSIDYNNLTNVPTLISSSTQVSYNGITDIPSGLVSGSSQVSYNYITDVPSGIVSGSSQIIDLGFTTTSSFNTFTSSYNNDSSSFDTRINTISGSVDNILQSVDGLELFSSSINNFTSSVVLNSQTSSMTVLSSSYALTASYVLGGGSGIGTEGRTARLDQTTPSTTWTFNHNLGEQFPAITIFDSFDNVVIPTSINAQDNNTLIITFSSPQSGTASATIGGGLPFISSSFDGYVLSAFDSTPSWKGGMVSGSLQITNLGFATTGSNTFIDNQTINGTLSISGSLVKQVTNNGINVTTTIASFETGSYDAGFFDYVIKDGSNLRAGTVTSVWDGNNITYNETTTNDLGDTTGVNMTVTISNGNANLRANISSGNWTIKVLSRGL